MEIDGQEYPLPRHAYGAVTSALSFRASQLPTLVLEVEQREGQLSAFFDIDGLIGVRVEAPEVFDRTHDFVTSLADDRVAGWRVDHVRRPHRSARLLGGDWARSTTSEREMRPIVLIEKIVARDEALPKIMAYRRDDRIRICGPRRWTLRERARRADLAGDSSTFTDLSHEAKRWVIANSFDAALERLARPLHYSRSMSFTQDMTFRWFDVRRA